MTPPASTVRSTRSTERIDATWKLSQNKPQDVRLAAVAGLDTAVSGSEIAALAALMAGVETS